MPYFSEAGIVATSKAAEDLLLSEAISFAKKLKSKHLELRQMTKLAADLPLKSDRVVLVLDLNPDPEAMMQRFDTKMRSNIRRSCKKGLVAEFSGLEFLDDFYEIFAHRMRDLGTPVYTKRFFEQILSVFPGDIFHLQGAEPTKDCWCVFHDWISEFYRIKLGGFPPRGKGSEGQHVHGVAMHVLRGSKGLPFI